MKTTTVFKDDNKKQTQFIEAALSGKYTILVFGGAIRGGKTFVVLAIVIMLCKIFPRSRWTIVRKDLKRLKDNTRPSLNKFIENTNVKVNESEQTFTFENGSRIIFKSENFEKDKTLEAFKGHETNGFVFEEISELREQTFYKGIERAGSYIISPEPGAGQPPPLIFATCNPTQGWFKTLVYDKWKQGKLPPHIFYLPSYVTDNPYLPKAYVDNLKNLPLYEYEVFVLGNWDITLKTKNAFWHAIDVNTHIKPVFYDDKTTIHISIDANTMPYCTATVWQVYPEHKKVRQIDEVIGRDPHNHAGGLSELVCEYLYRIEYSDTVFIYGDSTTKNQNTIDEKKRSFFDIFCEKIKENWQISDRFAAKNPQIVKTGEFVNALFSGYDGWIIEINENCKESLTDYLTVKTDMDGTMHKKKVTDEDGNSYEEFGHCSDTMRYFLYECLNEVYDRWEDRFSDPPTYESIQVEEYNPFDE